MVDPVLTEWVLAQKIYSKIQPLSCTNTHFDVTNLEVHGLVRYTKNWTSQERNDFFYEIKEFLTSTFDGTLSWLSYSFEVVESFSFEPFSSAKFQFFFFFNQSEYVTYQKNWIIAVIILSPVRVNCIQKTAWKLFFNSASVLPNISWIQLQMLLNKIILRHILCPCLKPRFFYVVSMWAIFHFHIHYN